MSEISDVLAAIESLSAKGERMALATIVAVRGSTYRRPGARLLVPEEGAPIGNISGGCLEGDVADVARVVMEEGTARLAGWDLTADDDAVWGLGLGCNGAIEVFIEPAEQAAEVAGALRMALEEARPISVVTVLESGRAGVGPGARLIVRPDGASEGTLGDPDVDIEALAAAGEQLAFERSEIRTLPGGRPRVRGGAGAAAAVAGLRRRARRDPRWCARPPASAGTRWWSTIARRSSPPTATPKPRGSSRWTPPSTSRRPPTWTTTPTWW